MYRPINGSVPHQWFVKLRRQRVESSLLFFPDINILLHYTKLLVTNVVRAAISLLPADEPSKAPPPTNLPAIVGEVEPPPPSPPIPPRPPPRTVDTIHLGFVRPVGVEFGVDLCMFVMVVIETEMGSGFGPDFVIGWELGIRIEIEIETAKTTLVRG